jgi:hypothetical protein
VSDADLRALFNVPAETPIVRLPEAGPRVVVHTCGADGTVNRVSVTSLLCWSPDGRPPGDRQFVGRCACGAIMVSPAAAR